MGVKVDDTGCHPLASDVNDLDVLADLDLARLPRDLLDQTVLEQDIPALDNLCNNRPVAGSASCGQQRLSRLKRTHLQYRSRWSR